MPPTVVFVQVAPVQHLGMGQRISDTTENTSVFFEIERNGLTTRTWWPQWVPGNPPWLPFIAPVWYSWSYTDRQGYLRNLYDVPSLAQRVSHQHSMPLVAPERTVESFRLRVDASDSDGNRAWTQHRLVVHRPVEIERRADRDRHASNAPAIVEAVSGVYPGPAKVTYSETQSRSCQRAYSEVQSGTVSAPLVAINVGFGFDVTATVSSADQHVIAKDVEISIDKGEVGVWFRKVQPYERHADVFAVDELGNRTRINELVVLDYLFSCYLGRGVDEASAHADARRRLA